MASPPRLLMVEGRDDKHALFQLLDASVYEDVRAHVFNRRSTGPSSVAVKEHGSFEKLRAAVPETLLKEAELDSVGIVADYDFPDSTPSQAHRWRSLQQVFHEHLDCDLPSNPPAEGWTGQIERLEGTIAVGIWLMPDNRSEGALEAFARHLVPHQDALLDYARGCLADLPERRFSEKDRDKALIHTWLAWQEKPNMRIGEAIGRGIFDAEQPLAERFVAWARRLFGT